MLYKIEIKEILLFNNIKQLKGSPDLLSRQKNDFHEFFWKMINIIKFMYTCYSYFKKYS